MSNKRDQILLATRDLIFEQGLQDVTMSKVAERAQVGIGTIYNYFPSKEDLIFSLFNEINATMTQRILERYDETEPLVVRVLYLLKSMVQYGLRHPREFLLSNQLAMVPFIHERVKGNVKALAEAFDQLLNDAQEQHLLKAMPPAVMWVLVSGAMNALVEAHMSEQIQLDDATIEQAMSACWDAIKR